RLVNSVGGECTQRGGEPGEVTLKLRERLLDIQRGVVEDTHGWMHPLG
ncbi:branched chain amino acid aminotransferase, partial [Streptomyces anulatus]